MKWVLLVLLALAIWGFYESRQPKTDEPNGLIIEYVQKLQGEVLKRDPNFKCDGRRFCSQMNSAEEAMFFLTNCPDTLLDDNKNGIPCEATFPESALRASALNEPKTAPKTEPKTPDSESSEGGPDH